MAVHASHQVDITPARAPTQRSKTVRCCQRHGAALLAKIWCCAVAGSASKPHHRAAVCSSHTSTRAAAGMRGRVQGRKQESCRLPREGHGRALTVLRSKGSYTTRAARPCMQPACSRCLPKTQHGASMQQPPPAMDAGRRDAITRARGFVVAATKSGAARRHTQTTRQGMGITRHSSIVTSHCMHRQFHIGCTRAARRIRGAARQRDKHTRQHGQRKHLAMTAEAAATHDGAAARQMQTRARRRGRARPTSRGRRHRAGGRRAIPLLTRGRHTTKRAASEEHAYPGAPHDDDHHN